MFGEVLFFPLTVCLVTTDLPKAARQMKTHFYVGNKKHSNFFNFFFFFIRHLILVLLGSFPKLQEVELLTIHFR